MRQAEEMAYMVEQTQDHLASLGVDSPALGADARHLADVDYPFLDYIDASGEKREWSNLCLG
jgi:hypothetical protein